MSAEFRIVSYLFFVVSLFLLPDLGFYAALLVAVSLCLATVPFRKLKAGWIPISIFLTYTFIGNAAFHSGRIVLIAGPVLITQEGLHLAALRTLKIFLMIGGVKFLMARTPTNLIVDAMANLLRPFEKIGVPVKDFFHVMGLTLKCFPILKETIASHYMANVQRNAAQNMFGRAKLMALFMLPLFVESIQSPELFFLKADQHEEEH